MKKKVGIIIFILIIMAGFIVGFLFFNPTIKAIRKLDYINNEEEMDEKMPLPQKMYLVVSYYKGELPTRVIFKSYYYLADTIIPKYNKLLKGKEAEEITDYFEKNKKVIMIETGIEEPQQFLSFINHIQVVNADKLELESYQIDSNTIQKQEDGLQSTLVIKYRENEEIQISTLLKNKKGENKTSLIVNGN